MGLSRLKNQWQHTSAILAMLANVNRGKNQKAFKADDFNPYKNDTFSKKAKVATKDDLKYIRNCMEKLKGKK